MQRDNDTNDFLIELKKSKLKLTYPRQRIFSVFLKTNSPLSIQELSAKLLDIHYTTVYRNAESLSRAGILNKIPHGFKFRYELSEKFMPHHHHATCEICGKSSKINSQHIEYLLDEASTVAGIKPTYHHIEVVGVCLDCQAL